MDARLLEYAHDAVILLDLHKRLKVDVGNARGLFLDAQQQLQIRLAVLGAADLPHALAHRRDLIQLAVVIAKLALDVAAVGLADGGEPRAAQAGEAAARELAAVAHIEASVIDGLQPRDI